MKHLIFALGAALGLLLLTTGGASAAEISQIQLQAAVLDGDGLPVTTTVAGNAYVYTLNYSITGSDLSGVAVTISAELPEGLWVFEQNAPASFTSNCHQAGTNQWKFDCTFSAADLDINTAGGIAGQARILVRSRRYAINHGDALTTTANIVANYTDTAGSAATATASSEHTMNFVATPAVQASVTFSDGRNSFKMMSGPDGTPGVAMPFVASVANIGTSPLSDVILTNTLPTGFRIAGYYGSSFSLVEPLWSSGTITFKRAYLGVWTSVNNSGGIASPGTQTMNVVMTLWAPCDVLATTRNEDGSLPDDMAVRVAIAATGYGLDGSGVVATQVVGDDSPSNNGVPVPNFTNWHCGTGQATFYKGLASSSPEPGGGVSWALRASPPISATYSEEAVVWDALDPTMTRFAAASVGTPDDGTFTIYYCDLSGDDTTPATMRGNFLGAWKDDETRCSTVAPADAAAWLPLSHIFFYAPTWGTETPELGEYALDLSASVTTVTDPNGSNGDVFQNSAWYESDDVVLLARTDTGNLSDEATLAFYTTANPVSVTGQNPPYAAPGEQLTFSVRPYRSGAVLPRNPVLTTTLPAGLIYKSSSVTWGARCVAAELEGTVTPGRYVPTDYTPQPTVTAPGDGSLDLSWSFGSAAHPFRLVGYCPGSNSNSADQLLVKVTVEVDPNGVYTNNQALTSTFHLDADNEAPRQPYDMATYALRVTVPGEMRVEVVPWCEEPGRIGFNSSYENSGGVDLTNVAVVFPMPESVDPAGAPYDVTQFAGATFADQTATLEYKVGGSWTATQPGTLGSIQAVRLLIPLLAANSGPQGFFVNIEVPQSNPGNSRIHATASMQADQLTDASSPVSIPFLVNTCPRALVVSKFFDADGDRVHDADEPFLKGWRFEVRDERGTLVDSRTTNAAGQVSFTLIQGTYTVTETLPDVAEGEPVWAPTTSGGVTQTVAIGLNEPSYALTFGNNCACDDGDPCTTDTCDPVQGCLSTPRSCDDGNACTADSCDSGAGGCVNVATEEGSACDDGSACTSGETCDGEGHCLAESTVTCEAAGDCVASSACNAATGACDVVYRDTGAACTGDSACKRFQCDGVGACVGAEPVDCDDRNACTEDSCDPEEGCVNKPLRAGMQCDDGDACTLADACDGQGKCGGTDVECNDNGLCQDPGTCDPKTGQCVYEATPCYLANFWTAVADDSGQILGSVKCGFDALGEPFCDTNADGSLKIYPEVQCVAPAGTPSLPAGDGTDHSHP